MAVAAPQPSSEPVLRLRGVGRRFGGVQAVRDVDLDVAHGERRAILGPNGAGKTTLFNVIAGDFKPTTGTIELMGHDLTNAPARRRMALGLSRTYQKSRLFPGLTVEDNLYLGIVGRDGGHLGPFAHRKTPDIDVAHARPQSACGSTNKLSTGRRTSRTGSSGNSRSEWRARSSRG